MTTFSNVPVVMAFSGNDPTGGAGIQADIEAIASMGCHTAPVITCLTVQDTHNVKEIVVCDPQLIIRQAETILADMPVAAIKIGLLGSTRMAIELSQLLKKHPNIPVILDPILSAGGGKNLANRDLIKAIKTFLLPLTTILTPNTVEARTLTNTEFTLDECGIALLNQGCEWVLITGTHDDAKAVTNRLYGNKQLLESYDWPRLQGSYHGSGCTLAAAIAGSLAQGNTPSSALHEAQRYAWETLHQGYRIGTGQFLPNRLFWAGDHRC